MNTIQKYTPFFVSALLMIIVLYCIYPHYQYYVDPDGTAYLTIAQRYAIGDYQHAINGYWSPWSCWLTAILIRQGLAAIPSSVIINTLGAAGFLFISQSFFLKFDIIKKLQWQLCVALSFFLCYAIFWQSFDDLWECFFLLTALRIMLGRGFKNSPMLWGVYGITGTLAYFAKAYSFPFFILNTICCTYFITKGNKLQWLKISITTTAVLIACSMPWICALHNKYGIWTTSTAGPLNTSWYLVGHKYWKPGTGLLVPPVYNNSPYFWEDPWFAVGATPHFWSSGDLLGLQIVRIGLNVCKLFGSLFQLSIFFPVIALVAILSVRVQKFAALLRGNIMIITLSFLLFPLGYLLVNFEPRYLWYMLPLGMVMSSVFFEKKAGVPHILALLFPLSFIVVPIWGMINMYDSGKREHDIAMQLKAHNIEAPFTGDGHPRVMSKIAWFAHLPYYFLRDDTTIDNNALLTEMHRYNMKYFIHLDNSAGQTSIKQIDLHDENGKLFPDATNGQVSGIKVYDLLPNIHMY